jgi:hypothetical protein
VASVPEIGSRPLAGVRLVGRRLLLHRSLQSTGCLFALVALVTFFLPLHEVRDAGFGHALGCAFSPDCHVTPRASSPSELLTQPPDEVHTGLHHGGAVPAVLLLLLAGGELLSLLRPRFWIGLATAIASLAGVALFAGTVFGLTHMLDHVQSLPAGRLHDAALVGFSLAALFDVLLQPLLYGGARRAEDRAPEPPGMPRARVRRSG